MNLNQRNEARASGRRLSPTMRLAMVRALDASGVWTGPESMGRRNVTISTLRALMTRGLLQPKGDWVELSAYGRRVAQLLDS